MTNVLSHAINECDTLTALEKTMLCFAADGGSRPMRGWKTCEYYERLIKKGYIEELPDGNMLFRKFVLSDRGRAKVREMVNEKRERMGARPEVRQTGD